MIMGQCNCKDGQNWLGFSEFSDATKPNMILLCPIVYLKQFRKIWNSVK